MATAQQLKALIKTYTAGDQDRFLSVTMQIAAHVARTGKGRLAEEFRALVDEAKRRKGRLPHRSRFVQSALASFGADFHLAWLERPAAWDLCRR